MSHTSPREGKEESTRSQKKEKKSDTYWPESNAEGDQSEEQKPNLKKGNYSSTEPHKRTAN